MERYRKEVKKGPSSMLAKLENVGFATYDRVLFEGLDLNIKRRDVIALIGKSGSGKTVLIKILAGFEHQQEGRVTHSSDIGISYVPQELDDIDVDPNVTIAELMREARGLPQLEAKMHEYEVKLSDPEESHEENLRIYGQLTERFQELNGYDPEPEMQRVLSGLGIDKSSTGNITLKTKLSEVSSGQLRRIMIARALFAKPDLLLLDDPTSHLDVASVDWLANHLRETNSAVVVASNSPSFLDKCSTQTVGLTDSGRVFSFVGNYSEFIEKRDNLIEAEGAEANSVAEKLEDLKETDRAFRSKQVYKRSADMAQVGRALATRIKKLQERYDDMPGAQMPYTEEQIRDMVFTQERRSGKSVLTMSGVVKKYGDYTAIDLRKTPPISISQGESWLIWGPNGSGKSTLVRMIAQKALGGSFQPDEGGISLGASVDLSYFSPDMAMVSRSGSLLDEVTRKIGYSNRGKAIATLRFFGFSTSAIYNLDVNMLSSGERKRVALAIIMLKGPNFLVLDEPTGDYMTNEIKSRLASALKGFDGTLLLVSHDQDFINQLEIDRELLMPEGKVLNLN